MRECATPPSPPVPQSLPTAALHTVPLTDGTDSAPPTPHALEVHVLRENGQVATAPDTKLIHKRECLPGLVICAEVCSEGWNKRMGVVDIREGGKALKKQPACCNCVVDFLFQPIHVATEADR